MAGVLSRPLFRQHYQTGGGVSDPWGYSSDQWERGKGIAGETLERGRGMGRATVEYLMKQGLSLEEAVEQIKNNPRLIEALERGRGVAGEALERGRGVAGEALERGRGIAGEALERGRAAIDDPRVRSTLERGRGMAGEALERGRGLMERLHGVPPGGFGAGSVNVPPGGFGAGSINVPPGGFGAGSINVPPGGFGGTNLPVPVQRSGLPVPVQRSGLPVPTSSDVGFPRSFDTDHIDSFRNKAGRFARGLGRLAMNPYLAAASIGIPLAYDALTDSPEELLDQLDTQTRAYVEYLMEQGVSIEEALKIASPSEEAPLERQAGGAVSLGKTALAGLGVGAAGGTGYSLHTLNRRQEQQQALALLPPEQRDWVKALVDQGMPVEEALEAVIPSEEDPSFKESILNYFRENMTGPPPIFGRDGIIERASRRGRYGIIERDIQPWRELPAGSYQEGGPVMSPQAMMPPPQGMPPQAMMAPPQAAPAGMDALMGQAPQMLSRAEGAVATRMEDVGREYVNNTLSAVDRAEDPEELINAIRGTDAPIEQRYDELAQIVGEQDAEATPPSVLTLVQPALMMTEQGAVDSGIGNLMQELSSSAEMLTGEGEATPMGEGVGNLMMAGAQPAMEALPPEAMMGPPPGAMMPPQAMMPPPPGGMAYGAPVQRFAQGGMVNSAEELARLGRGPDTKLVHMSPREVGALDEMARQRGFAGLPLNPQTGLPEAGLFDQAPGSGILGYLGGFAVDPLGSTWDKTTGLWRKGVDFYNNPTIQRWLGEGDFKTKIPAIAADESALKAYTIPEAPIQRVGPRDRATMPSYTAADLLTPESFVNFGSNAPLYNARKRAETRIRDGGISSLIADPVFDAPTIAPVTVTDTEATVIERPIRMDYEPGRQDFMVDYNDPERFKKNFDARLKLYEDVLGSDKDFTKSQMLFDIAGAGLNFAGGRGAGGENVATRSPAAQLAAAFSQVPKTMGERLALQRQEERGVKTAALAATEKEETARREVVADERKLKQNLLFDVSKGTFDANNLVNLTEGKMTHERTLATADRFLKGELARLSSSTDLAAVAMSGKINAARDEIGHLYNTIDRAATLDTRQKDRLVLANTALTQTNLTLANERELAQHREENQNIRSERELRLNENLNEARLRQEREALRLQRARGLDEWYLGLEAAQTGRLSLKLQKEIAEMGGYAEASQFHRVQEFKEKLSDRELRMFEKKLGMNFLMATAGQLTREDLLRESAFDRQLEIAMGTDNWNKFIYQLDESVRQFDIDHGLEADSIYGTLALKKRVLDQEALEYLKGSTPGVFDNIPGGTQAERDRRIFAMRPLWKRYAEGTLAPAQEDYLSALITGYLDPTLNAQGLETRKALPQMALAALRGRKKRGLTMPIQNAMDLKFEDVDPNFFDSNAAENAAERKAALDRHFGGRSLW
jgi:hypothetical protein